jgi:hypothetical protein
MSASDVSRRATGWAWIAAIWLGLGLFDAMQTVLVMKSEGMHHAWVRLFLVTVVSWLPWALATPFVLRLARRFPPLHLRSYATWLAHVGACLAVGTVFALWIALLYTTFNPYADANPSNFGAIFVDRLENGILSFIVLYAGILTVSYGLDSRARLATSEMEAARLSEGLSQAQLGALRRQIEPHFLFNTLNTVAGLVREDRGDDAIRLIASLSGFLRRMIGDANRQEVPLREELAFTRDYLAIQQMRFGERLEIAIDVPSEFEEARVPNLILQPIVENAIKHGISKRARGGAIRIAASSHGEALTLTVKNDGPPLAANPNADGPGVGVANVRARLNGLYGEASSFAIRDCAHGGVEVAISLPLRRSRVPA